MIAVHYEKGEIEEVRRRGGVVGRRSGRASVASVVVKKHFKIVKPTLIPKNKIHKTQREANVRIKKLRRTMIGRWARRPWRMAVEGMHRLCGVTLSGDEVCWMSIDIVGSHTGNRCHAK